VERFSTPERLAVIRETVDWLGIPLVVWSTEDPCWHEEWCVPYVEALRPDLVATICTEYVAKYHAMGFEAAVLPFGYNHELYRPVAPRKEYACDITVVASFYTAQFHRMNRKRSIHDLLTPLLDQGYDLRIWGRDWDKAPQYGVPVPKEMWCGTLDHWEAPAVYNSAKIVLGFMNEFDYATNLTMRICEIMGAGGFLLTSRTSATEALFTHGQHLVMSASPAETLALVEHYLGQPEERAQIAAAGERLVRANHTYAHRARVFVELVTLCTELRRRQRHCWNPALLPCLPPRPYCPCDDSSSSDSESGSETSSWTETTSDHISWSESLSDSSSESESLFDSSSETESDTDESGDRT
jgi:spore maturation protein CgeB